MLPPAQDVLLAHTEARRDGAARPLRDAGLVPGQRLRQRDLAADLGHERYRLLHRHPPAARPRDLSAPRPPPLLPPVRVLGLTLLELLEAFDALLAEDDAAAPQLAQEPQVEHVVVRQAEVVPLLRVLQAVVDHHLLDRTEQPKGVRRLRRQHARHRRFAHPRLHQHARRAVLLAELRQRRPDLVLKIQAPVLQVHKHQRLHVPHPRTLGAIALREPFQQFRVLPFLQTRRQLQAERRAHVPLLVVQAHRHVAHRLGNLRVPSSHTDRSRARRPLTFPRETGSLICSNGIEARPSDLPKSRKVVLTLARRRPSSCVPSPGTSDSRAAHHCGGAASTRPEGEVLCAFVRALGDTRTPWTAPMSQWTRTRRKT